METIIITSKMKQLNTIKEEASTKKVLNKSTAESSEGSVSNSSAFVDVIGINSTTESNVGTICITDSTRGIPIAGKSTNINAPISHQIYTNDEGVYSGTEICIGCLKKKSEIEKATHFCKDCDTFGRYICYPCMADHDLYTKNHDVKSLSVHTEKQNNWRYKDDERPVTRVQTNYKKTSSWVQYIMPDDKCEYDEPGVLKATSLHVGISSSDISYTRQIDDPDEVQRIQIPRPQVYKDMNPIYAAVGENKYSYTQNEFMLADPASNNILQREPEADYDDDEDGVGYTRLHDDLDVLQKTRIPRPQVYKDMHQCYAAAGGNKNAYTQNEDVLFYSARNNILQWEVEADYDNDEDDVIYTDPVEDPGVYQRSRMPVQDVYKNINQSHAAVGGHKYSSTQNEDVLTDPASNNRLQWEGETCYSDDEDDVYANCMEIPQPRTERLSKDYPSSNYQQNVNEYDQRSGFNSQPREERFKKKKRCSIM